MPPFYKNLKKSKLFFYLIASTSLSFILLIGFCFLILRSNYIPQSNIIILDTDVNYDDILALTYLLKNPNIQIKAISTVNGATSVDKGYLVVKKLLSSAGKPHIPVIMGEKSPLKSNGSFPSWLRKAAENILTIPEFEKIPITKGEPYSLLHMENIFKRTNTNEKITIIATGPLTNIAKLLEEKPHLKRKIKELWIMGGAIIDANEELNFATDPYAANVVFKSGLPIFWVPLEVTEEFPVTKKRVGALLVNPNKDSLPIDDIYNKIIKLFAEGEKKYFWDVAAVVIATNPELATLRPKEPNVYIVEKVNVEKIYEAFFATINR